MVSIFYNSNLMQVTLLYKWGFDSYTRHICSPSLPASGSIWNSLKMNNVKIIKSQYFKHHLCWPIFRWMHCEIWLKVGFSPSYFQFQDINVSTVISLLNGGKLWGITWDVNTPLTLLDTAVIAVTSPLCVRQAWETTERGYMSSSGSSVANVHPLMAMLQVGTLCFPKTGMWVFCEKIIICIICLLWLQRMLGKFVFQLVKIPH